MNREQLKEALLDLAKQEPGFMRDLIGEVVKSSLSVDSVSDDDYSNPGTTYVLRWQDGPYYCHEFSRAY